MDIDGADVKRSINNLGIKDTALLNDMLDYVHSQLRQYPRNGYFNNGKRWSNVEKDLATNMVGDGINMDIISEVMGRSSVSVTMKLEAIGVVVPDNCLTDKQKQHKEDLEVLSKDGYTDISTLEAQRALRVIVKKRQKIS